MENSSDIVIDCRNLSRIYSLGNSIDYTGTLLSTIGKMFRTSKNQQKSYHTALKDISFTVSKGEIVGIIGHNGAGKSTLLKVLSRITPPSAGIVYIKGSVGTLLEVGTGFHPDLTGRENIFMNGSLLGLKKNQIVGHLDEIIEFAGIGAYIDQQVKKYSSGMKVRLAFAVAAFLKADILFVDEVLAVGDADFQKKCLAKMSEVSGSGRTIIFVSHNMAAIKSLCKRVIWLDKGQIKLDAQASEVISAYLHQTSDSSAHIQQPELNQTLERFEHVAGYTMDCREVTLQNDSGECITEFYSDETINVRIIFTILQPVRDFRLLVNLCDEDHLSILNTQISDSADFTDTYPVIRQETYIASVIIPANSFGSKAFSVTVELINPDTEHLIYRNCLSFKVNFKGYNNIQRGSFPDSILRPLLNWQIIPNEAA